MRLRILALALALVLANVWACGKKSSPTEPPALNWPPLSGDLLITKSFVTPDYVTHALLLRRSLATGNVDTIAAGPPMAAPTSVTVGPDGMYYVLDATGHGGPCGTYHHGPTPCGAVIRIDPSSGAQTVIVDSLSFPSSMVWESSTTFLVSANRCAVGVYHGCPILYRVDIAAGGKSVVWDGPAGGPVRLLGQLTMAADGRMFAAVTYESNNEVGIVRLDLATGAFDEVLRGGKLLGVRGIIPEGDTLFVLSRYDHYPQAGLFGAILKVNLTTGTWTLHTSGGGLWADPRDFVLLPNGEFIVLDGGETGIASGRLYRLDYRTGAQLFISPWGDYPSAIAYVP